MSVHALTVGGRRVADYVVRPDVPAHLSPRPYLHPVRTLGGVAVTDASPADHPHHIGVSLAVQDVNKVNLWGGPTYVRDTGYTLLDDHGRIEHDRFEIETPDHLIELLNWCDLDGDPLITERRELRASAVPGRDDAWQLDVGYTLTAARDVTLGSPATNGRPDGAGYGGFFWRAAEGERPPEVFTADTAGEEAVNGSAEPWIAMAGDGWTLIFAGLGDGDHWFVRAVDYPGVCAALAFEQPRTINEGDTLARQHTVIVADGHLPRDAVTELAEDT